MREDRRKLRLERPAFPTYPQTVHHPGEGTRMAAPTAKTFVLVHGAWHGGWCWRRVADLLERQGHKVFAPTLTGLGERSHLMSKEIRLATHVTDVVNHM